MITLREIIIAIIAFIIFVLFVGVLITLSEEPKKADWVFEGVEYEFVKEGITCIEINQETICSEYIHFMEVK